MNRLLILSLLLLMPAYGFAVNDDWDEKSDGEAIEMGAERNPGNFPEVRFFSLADSCPIEPGEMNDFGDSEYFEEVRRSELGALECRYVQIEGGFPIFTVVTENPDGSFNERAHSSYLNRWDNFRHLAPDPGIVRQLEQRIRDHKE